MSFNITLTWSWLLAICIGLFGISVMVIVHELGHMFAAKLSGIEVESLSFGFGPALFKWGKGETQFRIALIPFGGMCKMKGHDDLQTALDRGDKRIETAEKGSLWAVKPINRILTYAAGPFSNMLFAFVCYALLLALPTVQSFTDSSIAVTADYPTLYNVSECAASRAGLETGDHILSIDGIEVTTYSEVQNLLSQSKDKDIVTVTTDRGTFAMVPQDGLFGIVPYVPAVVGHVYADTPEKNAGLKAGDIIKEVNGKSVTNMFDLLEASNSSTRLDLVVLRGNEEVALGFDCPDSVLNFTLLQSSVRQKGIPFFKALKISTRECFSNFMQSVSSLLGVIFGKSNAKETLGGTYAASQSIGMITEKGFASGFNNGLRVMFYLLASVSISLCVANLLPIPSLDGGLIILSLAELVTGRTFSPKFYTVLQVVGTIIVFGSIALLSLA